MRLNQTGRLITAVLFDLDGTLLDSAPDLVATLNHLREIHGLAALPVSDLRQHVSRGAVGLIKAGMPPCDDETLASWRAAFLSHYEQNSFIESRPFDGVESLLSELTGRNIPWGIVTNKMEFLSFPILERTGWLSRASAVICGDTVSHAKPHPEPVLAACRTIGVDPGSTLMVGDDPRDMQAGISAGSQTAFALYGYAEPGNQPGFDEDTVTINTPEEILGLLEFQGLA